MKVVYVVLVGFEDEPSYVIGVYASRSAADAAEEVEVARRNYDYVEIEEFEVIDACDA